MDLHQRRCVPCEGGTPALHPDEARALAAEVPRWSLEQAPSRLRRKWTMDDFRGCLAAIQKIALIAEHEGHHPDLHLTQYKHLEVVLWTHSVQGLSYNDFILAAKIDEAVA